MGRKTKVQKNLERKAKLELLMGTLKDGVAIVARAVDPLVYGALAYMSWKEWDSPLAGPIALKLAVSPNIVAGGAGLLTLTALGLAGTGWIEEGKRRVRERENLEGIPWVEKLPELDDSLEIK